MTVTVVTFNAPHRLRPHQADFQREADAGADIICAQEHADIDKWTPRGWRVFNPKASRSTAVYWNPATVTAKKKGFRKTSSPGFHELRGLTWVHFQTKLGPLRVASAHPPAFKTSRPSHAREYRKQEKRMANWLDKGRFRAIGGDINGTIPSRTWTPTLSKVGRWSRQVPSGPHGMKIDYVGVNRSGPWRVVATELGPKGRSDHRPVRVVLGKR